VADLEAWEEGWECACEEFNDNEGG